MTKRDLHADLAICNAATAGLWALDYDWEERRYCVEAVDVPSWGGGVIVADCGQDADARFIAEARTGWPHAVERAMAAEDRVSALSTEVERLRSLNQTLLQREGQSNGRLLTRIRELEADVSRLNGNCQALFDTLMEALEYVPGEIDTESQQIIAKIRTDIFGEEEAE